MEKRAKRPKLEPKTDSKPNVESDPTVKIVPKTDPTAKTKPNQTKTATIKSNLPPPQSEYLIGPLKLGSIRPKYLE